MIVGYEIVDYGAQGEYGMLGKVVARLDVRGMSPSVAESELADLLSEFGGPGVVEAREVEEVPAAAL